MLKIHQRNQLAKPIEIKIYILKSINKNYQELNLFL